MMQPREWLVCFYDPVVPRRWWHRCFKPGFRHCNVISFIPGTNRWLVVDWSLQGLAIYFLMPSEMTPQLSGLQLVGRVLRVAAAEQHSAFRMGTWSLWCVTMVRHVIGFHPFALTPWGLFCALRRAGAQEIFVGSKKPI